ncbi:MAG TPA: hypothetical protein V6C72_18010 [Chroococcales cyanobacterium]
MVKGTLHINFEPTFIGFAQHDADGDAGSPVKSWRFCTLEEVRSLLVSLNALGANEKWHPREYVLRLDVELSEAIVKKLDAGVRPS